MNKRMVRLNVDLIQRNAELRTLVKELAEALQSVWNIKSLLEYPDSDTHVHHRGEAEAVANMLSRVDQALKREKGVNDG